MLLASRSILVTSTSPWRRKSRTVRNSSRPWVVVPDRFSERIVVQRSRFRAATWISRSWSVVLSRASNWWTVPAWHLPTPREVLIPRSFRRSRTAKASRTRARAPGMEELASNSGVILVETVLTSAMLAVSPNGTSLFE
jgi:hypothetical protein